jgi:hypothetical protein
MDEFLSVMFVQGSVASKPYVNQYHMRPIYHFPTKLALFRNHVACAVPDEIDLDRVKFFIRVALTPMHATATRPAFATQSTWPPHTPPPR